MKPRKKLRPARIRWEPERAKVAEQREQLRRSCRNLLRNVQRVPFGHMKWIASLQLMTGVKRRDRSLIVAVTTIGRGVLGVAAIETATSITKKRGIRAVDAIFDDHGHRTVGSFKTVEAAVRAAEAFAKKWKRGTPIEECPCEEILTPRQKRRANLTVRRENQRRQRAARRAA